MPALVFFVRIFNFKLIFKKQKRSQARVSEGMRSLFYLINHIK